jgi:hypothetical protein
MPIVIKEIFSSDPISEALEKINFNFDQLILSGGGPPGPIGPIGLPGVAGPQGLRGDHWQVGGASGSLGFTGPTSDHGPNFGNLQDSDSWVDANGNVWIWQGGATDSWVYSGVNITGPTGVVGPTGGSTDLQMYLGHTGGAASSSSYLPSTIGPTSVSAGDANFFILNKIDVNSFLLGDPAWAYNKLTNFGNIDLVNSNTGSTSSQRMLPKQAIIQSGIDYSGFGGLAIGAYGLTGASTSTLNDYKGGSAQASTVNGNSFFNAGWKIRLNTNSTYSHVFNLKTGFNDIEIQSGDINSSLGTTTGKISVISNTIELKGITETDPIRFTTGPTYSRFRDLLAVGFDTTTDTTVLPGIIVADGYTNRFIVGGDSRIHGVLRVGNRSTATNQIYIGTERLVAGNSEINFYGGVANTGLFQIQRSSGVNGDASISNTGTGSILINNSASNILFTTAASSGFVAFQNNSLVETARFDTVNNRLGIGTVSPATTLHVNSPLGINQTNIATFSNKVNTSYTAIVAANAATTVTSWTDGSNILEFVPSIPLSTGMTGNGIIGTYIGNLKFQTGYRQDRMIITENLGYVGIGTNTPTDRLTVGAGDISLPYGNSIRARGFAYSKLIETMYDSVIGNDVTNIYTAGAYAGNIDPKITITSGGNVGIGTTGPASKLHIRSTSNLYQDANIKLEGDIFGNQSIIDFYPFGRDPNAAQNPAGFPVIGPRNENLQGRFGYVGYRESFNTSNSDRRNLFISSDRYNVGVIYNTIANNYRSTQSELGGVRIEAAGIINLRVNQYNSAPANSSAPSAMPTIYNVDMLTIVPGTGIYSGVNFSTVTNTNPRIGINNTAPLAGYILHINGNTLLDGNLVFGGNLSGGGTAANYSIKTLGATSLSIGTQDKTNIFVRWNDGNVGIGNPSTTVKSNQIKNPLSPLQVTIPIGNQNGYVVPDTLSPHTSKHNFGRYIGSLGNYQKGLIMLHPASDGKTPIPYSMCCGKFYILRGGVFGHSGLIIDTIEVDSASGDVINRGVVKANMSADEDGTGTYRTDEETRRDNVFLTTVELGNGDYWVALYIGYVGDGHDVYFDGINTNSGWGSGNYAVNDMYYFHTYTYNGGAGFPFPGTPGGGFYNLSAYTANQTVFTNKYDNYTPIVQGPGPGPNGYNINKYHRGVDVFSGIKFQNEPGEAAIAYIKNKFAFHISFQTSTNVDPSIIFNSGYIGGIENYGPPSSKQIGFWMNRLILPDEHVIFNITPAANYLTNKQLWMIDYGYTFDDPSTNRTYFRLFGVDLPSGVNNYQLQVEGTVWTQ